MSETMSSAERRRGLALIQGADPELAGRFAYELSQQALAARVAAAAASEERRIQIHDRAVSLLESITDPDIHARAVGAFADLAEAEKIRAQDNADERKMDREGRAARVDAWWGAEGIARQVAISILSIAGTAAAFYFSTGGS